MDDAVRLDIATVSVLLEQVREGIRKREEELKKLRKTEDRLTKMLDGRSPQTPAFPHKTGRKRMPKGMPEKLVMDVLRRSGERLTIKEICDRSSSEYELKPSTARSTLDRLVKEGELAKDERTGTYRVEDNRSTPDDHDDLPF